MRLNLFHIVMICGVVLFTSVHANAQPNEIFKLTAPGASEGDLFGRSVSISGNTVVVGARGRDDKGPLSGSAYVFDAATGKQQFRITGSDTTGHDLFGTSVAVSGNTAAIGATGNDQAGINAGAAYLFDTTTGNQLLKLTASDAVDFDNFGVSVAISGNTVIVGSQGHTGGNFGSAYLFDSTTGDELFKLTASDAARFDNFGASVAISGNIAVVGAAGNGTSGAAYVFDITTGNQLFKLTASDDPRFNHIGASVAVYGDIAVVGASSHSGSDGSAYLFDVTTGNQLFKLRASDPAAYSGFGLSVAINDSFAIVGAPGGFQFGRAYVYSLSSGEELSKFSSADSAVFDQFGGSVALSGNTAVLGASLDEQAGIQAGAAYIFNNIPEPASGLFFVATALVCLRRLNN